MFFFSSLLLALLSDGTGSVCPYRANEEHRIAPHSTAAHKKATSTRTHSHTHSLVYGALLMGIFVVRACSGWKCHSKRGLKNGERTCTVGSEGAATMVCRPREQYPTLSRSRIGSPLPSVCAVPVCDSALVRFRLRWRSNGAMMAATPMAAHDRQ